MKPLVDLTKIIDIINKKIDSNDFNFDEFEMEIIMSNAELHSKFMSTLSNNYNAWRNISKAVYDVFQYNYEIEFTKDLLRNYIFSLIDRNRIDGILESSLLDESLLHSIREYLKQKLFDLNYIPKLSFPDKEILKLITEIGRMDLLESIKSIREMYPETEVVLKNYYSNNSLEIPAAIFPFFKDLNIPFKRMKLRSILECLENNNQTISNEDFKVFIIKITTSEFLTPYNFKWERIFSNFNERQQEELMDDLLAKGYYEVIGQFDFLNGKNIENYSSKFINSITINSNPELEILDFNVNGSYVSLLNDSRVLLALIKNNKLLTASYSSEFKNYLNEVISQIKNNPSIYRKLKVKQFKNLSYYPEVIFELFRVGNENLDGLIKNNSELKSKVKNSILSGEINIIPSSLVNDDDFINLLITSGHIDLVFKTSSIIHRTKDLNLTAESIEVVIEKAKKDSKFAMQFLNHNIFVVINNNSLLNFFLKANYQSIEIILNRLNHLEENKVAYTEEMFQLVKHYLITKYQLNPENLERFAQHFGPLVIRYVSNENIQSIINMNQEIFNKFLNLFPKIDFTMRDVEAIYDSLKQFEFSKINNEVIEVFARIKHFIANNNLEYLNEFDKILVILKEIEDREKFYRKFNEVYPNLFENFTSNPKEFLINTVKFIQNGTMEEKDYYMQVLHFITDYYIAYQREKYRDTYEMHDELNIPYELDSKDKVRQFIKHCAVRIHKKLITLEMVDRGIDESLAADCIDFYGYDRRDFSDERIKEIEKHIKILLEITNRILKVTGISDNIVETLDSERKIKRKYYVEANNSNIFSILSELNIETLTATILDPNNNDLYQSLLTYIYKYKLHLLPDYFKDLMSNEYIDISIEVSDIASFITYYSQIYEEEVKRLNSQGKDISDFNMSFITIMKYAESYSSVSNIYNQILGIEDARLIKCNPKPNSASRKTKGTARLDEAVEWTLNNFRRNEVTIPTFNEIINIGEKSLRVVVGNFTHPANVTMGERTGSCMRIGGPGDTLFDFILEDKNGFHIRFDNPTTGEFISRVSGFRNGNTVFLNELRYSCNPEQYSNQDVVNVCTKVAKILIERSANCPCPIENVVLHNAYATEDLEMKEEFLEIGDNRQGLRNFYCDIKDKGIILATTGEPFTKVDFDKSKVSSWPTAREVCYKGTDSKKLRMIINRVHTIKHALDGISYEYIAPINFEKDIYYGIANQDFYIFMDCDGKVYEEIINIDERALIELEEARKIISNLEIKEDVQQMSI